MSTEQIQLYVNLEPWAVTGKEAGNSLNFATFFDHLQRAVEIPMIQFLEQMYNEAALRAQNTSAATPKEFQVLLREFVREPSEQRQQVFLEHLRAGKHSIEHLGTIVLFALRTLTQSLASEDYELVALAQAQEDAARFYIQTGLTYAKLFLDAITEAARLMDRNPTYFSRRAKSTDYLQNRAHIRAQVTQALRASLNDVAIKAFTSLRQHVAERALQHNVSTNAMADQQKQSMQSHQSTMMQQLQPLQQQPMSKVFGGAVVTSTGNAPSLPQMSNVPPLPHATGTMPARSSSPSATPPPPPQASKKERTAAELDQRASPMSSNDARVAQKDLVKSLLTVSNKAQMMQQQHEKEQQEKDRQKREAQPLQVGTAHERAHAASNNRVLEKLATEPPGTPGARLPPSRIRLEDSASMALGAAKTANSLSSANNMASEGGDNDDDEHREDEQQAQHDEALVSMDLLTNE
jgi:hypothetical protein